MFAREDLIQEAQSLEPLPASSARLSKILSNEDWTLDEVAKTAALDQALTGRLLRCANSAASGAKQPITSVGAAVMRMGPGMALSIAMGEGLRGTLQTDLPAYGMDEGALWRHSVATALAVEAMRKAGLKPPPGTFIAALVHDVGKLVIGRKLKSSGIRLTFGDSDEAWTKDESEQLGIDHGELGGSIARSWELPVGIPEAVENHHYAHLLEPGPAKTMVQFVAAADAIAHALDEDGSFWNPMTTTHLGLSQKDQEEVGKATGELLESVMQLYN